MNNSQLEPDKIKRFISLYETQKQSIFKGTALDDLVKVLSDLLIEAEVTGYKNGRSSVGLSYSHNGYDLRMQLLQDTLNKENPHAN